MKTSTAIQAWRRLAMLVTVTSAVSMLQACSGLLSADDAYEQGWRHARVVQIGIGTEPIPRIVKDCRTELPPDETRRFVVLSYSEGNHYFGRRYVAAVPQNLGVKIEHVYQVNIKDCNSRWYRVR